MVVGVVGQGYVGLPLSVGFAEAGHDVVALDVDAGKIASLQAGESYVEDIPSARLAAVLDRFEPTTDYAALVRADAILIAVPTPLTAQREPDLGPLDASTRAVAGVLRAGQIVVLESTTYPGTTRDRMVPVLEQVSGLKAGTDFHVAFSPERVDPGRTDFTLRTTPKVLGGLTPACLEAARGLYAQVCDHIVEVSTPEAAEMSKLLENIFRAVNIALVNEMAIIADRMDIDIWEVVEAAATKPYGFMRFDPGPGMGGHCLPVDPFYLTWRAREFDITAEFIELAGRFNQMMPYHCVTKIEQGLNDRELAVKGSKIALLGVSYKGGVGDMRESPALKIIELLRRRGAEVVYHDEFVPELPAFGLTHTPLEEALDGAACTVVVTAHPGVDHIGIAERVPLLVDLRGVTRGHDLESVERL